MVYSKKQTGFTIVELMIAISVFAVAMMLVMGGVLMIGRQYQQGVTRTKLESASREIHQNIANSIQFASGEVKFANDDSWRSLCVGNQRYTYAFTLDTYDTEANIDGLKSGLYIDNDIVPGSCSVPNNTGNPENLNNLLPNDSKVLKLSFSNDNTISTVFIRSDSDLLDIPDTVNNVDNIRCKGAVTGKEYCAVVQFNSTAIRRTNN